MAVVFTLLGATPHRLVYNVTSAGAESGDRARAAVEADCVPGPLLNKLSGLADWGYPAVMADGELKLSITPAQGDAVGAQLHTGADGLAVDTATAADTIVTLEFVHSIIL